MNTDRLYKMVLLNMTSNILKLEAELERAINNPSMETEKKVKKISQILTTIAAVEAGMTKFNSMLENNKETK